MSIVPTRLVRVEAHELSDFRCQLCGTQTEGMRYMAVVVDESGAWCRVRMCAVCMEGVEKL